MVQEALFSISIIIGIAAILIIIAKIIRQPPIIAYLIAGVIVGPLFLNVIGPSTNSAELLQVFARLGVAFLLFIVGLSLDVRVLKEIGGVSTFAGLTEVILTGTIGFLIAVGLGFSNATAIYLGTALAFSSTVVVVKILSDKKELGSLHGKLALGILIVEDIIATIALMTIPLLKQSGNLITILEKLGIGVVLIVLIFLFSTYILKRFMDQLAKNQEVLFLFGIAWALALASVFQQVGFSLEIGALIAGMTLASNKYTLELGGKIKPLRDFFIILFFVFFGSQLSGNITPLLVKQAFILSAFIVIGKPIIVMTSLRIFGYKKRTNFLAASSLAQISEFSLILTLLGFSLGHLTQEIMSLVVMVALITICASSYSVYYSHKIFEKVSKLLNLFEGKDISKTKEESYDIILMGNHRIGYKVLNSIKKIGKSFAVVDYNPKVILSLSKEGINSIYGDVADKYFLSELPLDKAKLIISTIPDETANIIIKERLKEINSKAVFIATAEQPRTALDLYEEGIDYVVIPHHLGGDFIANMIEQLGIDKSKYKEKGNEHKSQLNKAKKESNFY